MKQFLASILFLCCWTASASSESTRLKPASVADNWRWNELTSLQSYQIKSGTEDKEGNLWFVHKDGLIKYDGVSFDSYPADGFLLEGTTDLFISKSGVAVIPSDSGLHVWDDGAFFLHTGISYSLGSRNAVAEDDTGRLFTVNWATGGLVSIVGNTLYEIDAQFDRPTSILIDTQSNLWVVESGKRQVSVFKLKGEGDLLEIELIHRIPCNPKNQFYTRLLEDSKGRVWVIDPDDQDRCYYYVDYQVDGGFSGLRKSGLWGETLNVVETQAGNILFCLSRRLGRLDGDELTVLDIQDYPIPSSSPYLRVLNSGKLLIGGRNLTPYLIDLSNERWQTYPGLNFQCEDPSGTKWFLSYDRKVVSERAGDWHEYSTGSGLIDNPNRIIAGLDGSIWVSGAHNGKAAVAWYYDGEWSLQSFPEASATFSHLAALQVGEGRFAFGCGTPRAELGDMLGGGVIFEKSGNHYRGTHFPPPVFLPRTATMVHMKGSGLYMGEGIIARGFSNEELMTTDLKVFYGQWIDHMIVDRENKLWVACLGIGVYEFDGVTWRLHGHETGLTDQNVICLLDDSSKGGILALTESGFLYYDGAQWRSWEFRSNVPFRRENHTLFQSSDGAIWINFSSRSWFLEGDTVGAQLDRFKTIRYVPDSRPPESSVSLSRMKYPEGSQVYVQFDAVDPWDETPRDDLMFSWKLNDGDWSDFSKGLQTVLDHLESGFYNIHVRARDMEGNIDSSPASLAFSITPPLWKSPLFVLGGVLLLLLVIALAYSLFRVRVQAAVAMESFKLDFFTNISHELRNPLAVILAPIERLLRDESSEEKRTNLRIVLRNARKMQGMVDQLLRFRKLQSGKWEAHPANCEIISVCRDSVNNLRPLWEEKQQQLELTVSHESFVCAFDTDILQTIIDNLLSNAVKYSEPGTSIFVRVDVAQLDKIHQLTLEVEDEGASISPHERENILTPFYRINNQGGEMGTGIGLALVDQFVKLCGGTIEIESPVTPEGKGSRFTVNLPLDKVDQKQDADLEKLANPYTQGSRTTVLLVEDNADFRHVIAQELSAHYSVVEAVDGEEGLNLSIKINPDIIVSDVIMPKMDGFDLCERLKSDSQTSHIPIILLTAKSADEHRIKGLQLGADAYISKPLKFDHLLARINNLLTSRQELRQQFTREILIQPSEITVTPTDQAILEKAIKLVDENMMEEDFDVQQFSRMMGMSKSSLVRKLKAITGLTPLHFIQTMRLKRAAALLKEGISVSDAAAQVGMYNMSYFSKLFRKEFGVVPSEYRKAT